jgi:membrane protein implicated in regulation of membrane protease activity
MRCIIGVFIAFVVAVVAYDLGLRLPLDLGFQFALVGVLSLASWALVSRFSDDEPAHHHH